MLRNLLDIKFLKYNLRKNNLYFLIFGLLMFAVFPLPVIIEKINHTGYDPSYGILYRNPSFYYNTAYGTMVVFISILTPFILFNYLNSKKSVDVFHALPVKRSALFLTHVLTGIILIAIPMIVNYVLGHLLYSSFFGSEVNYYVSLPIDMLSGITILFVFSIMIQALSTFVILNTGTLIDGFIHLGIFLALPFFIYLTITAFSSSFLFGSSFLSFDTLKGMTPLYAIYHALIQETFPTQLILYWIAVYIMFMIIQTNMYVKLKSESSEEPFTNKYYFPIITVIFTALLFILINTAFSAIRRRTGYSIQSFFALDSILLAVILSFVGYTILSIFKNRSTKYFLKTIRNFTLIVVTTTLMSVTLIQTQAFGMVWKVPKANAIQSIEMNDSTMFNIHPFINFTDYMYGYNNVKIEDPEFIETFVKVHKSINEKVKREKTFLRTGDMSGLLIENNPCLIQSSPKLLSFTYNLKNGQSRDYEISVPHELLMDFKVLLLTQGFQEYINPVVNQEISLSNLSIFNDVMDQKQRLTDVEKIRETLIAHYFNDLAKLTIDDLTSNPKPLKYVLEFKLVNNTVPFITRPDGYYGDSYEYNTQNYMFIDERFEETVAYLDTLYTNPQANTTVTYALQTTKEQNDLCGAIAVGHYYGGYEDMDNEYENYTNLDSVDAYRGKLLGSHFLPNESQYLIINDSIFVPIGN